MRFDVKSIYFGVAVQMSDRINHSYSNATDKVKIWFEDGFFYIDDGGQDVICIVAANIRQFTKKRQDESSGEETLRKVRKSKLEQ